MFSQFGKILTIFLLTGSLVMTLASLSWAGTVTGTVFLDQNANGQLDPEEHGLPGVGVSNQKLVVLTNDAGVYSLELGEEGVVFVIKPAEYDLPQSSTGNLQSNGNLSGTPSYYRFQRPTGSPDFCPLTSQGGSLLTLLRNETKSYCYPGIEKTGVLSSWVDFPLLPGQCKEDYSVILMGDPQPDDQDQIDYLRRDVLGEMMVEPAVQSTRFGLILGDVASDHLEDYPEIKASFAPIGKPWFAIPGNHDLNWYSPVDQWSTETWQKYFGPIIMPFMKVVCYLSAWIM
jgi:hypothetical protein